MRRSLKTKICSASSEDVRGRWSNSLLCSDCCLLPWTFFKLLRKPRLHIRSIGSSLWGCLPHRFLSLLLDIVYGYLKWILSCPLWSWSCHSSLGNFAASVSSLGWANWALARWPGYLGQIMGPKNCFVRKPGMVDLTSKWKCLQSQCIKTPI